MRTSHGAGSSFRLGFFAQLNIGAEAAVAQGNVKAGFRIGAENLRAVVTFAIFTARLAELPCKAALGIVGAADESAPAADLER